MPSFCLGHLGVLLFSLFGLHGTSKPGLGYERRNCSFLVNQNGQSLFIGVSEVL